MKVTIALSAAGASAPASDSDLLLRVSSEFQEMPDLAITVGEASRLFDVDRQRCRRILDTLVSDGVLTTDGRVFALVGTGRRST
jgi:hypothetical protein